jgi:hypothetical protein
MEWISENWLWIALAAAVAWLYLRSNLAGRGARRTGTAPESERGAAAVEPGNPEPPQSRHHGCC